jgi:hypothetical protein
MMAYNLKCCHRQKVSSSFHCLFEVPSKFVMSFFLNSFIFEIYNIFGASKFKMKKGGVRVEVRPNRHEKC